MEQLDDLQRVYARYGVSFDKVNTQVPMPPFPPLLLRTLHIVCGTCPARISATIHLLSGFYVCNMYVGIRGAHPFVCRWNKACTQRRVVSLVASVYVNIVCGTSHPYVCMHTVICICMERVCGMSLWYESSLCAWSTLIRRGHCRVGFGCRSTGNGGRVLREKASGPR